MGRMLRMIGGPKLMFGTKWPSITSRCKKSAPPVKTSWISAPSFEKSAERIDAASWGAVVLNGFSVIQILVHEWTRISMNKKIEEFHSCSFVDEPNRECPT